MSPKLTARDGKVVDDPNNANQFIRFVSNFPPLAYVWFIVIAIWGGTANYISRIKKSKTPFSIVEWLGELCISGFSGVITAYIGLSQHWDFFIIAAAAGVAGHAGGRGIFVLEQLGTRFVARKFGINLTQDLNPQDGGGDGNSSGN